LKWQVVTTKAHGGHVLDKQAIESESAKEETEPEQTTDQSMTFWHLARTSRVLQAAFLVSLFANITFGGLLEVALPSLAHGPFAAGVTGYGTILAAFGVGALLVVGAQKQKC